MSELLKNIVSEEFTKSLTFSETRLDSRFGIINILKDSSTDSSNIMMITHKSNDLDRIDRNVRQIEERLKLNNAYLLKMFGFSKVIGQTNEFFLHVFYEHPKKSLNEEFENRQKEVLHFNSEELLQILNNVLHSLSHLQSAGIVYGEIKPKYIALPNDLSQFYTLLDKLKSKKQQNPNGSSFKKSKMYISQAMFNSMNGQKEMKKPNPFKSQSFSLGLVILECGLLHSIQNIYGEKEFKREKLNQLLVKFNSLYQSNAVLLETISALLDENERVQLDAKNALTLMQKLDPRKFEQMQKQRQKSENNELKIADGFYSSVVKEPKSEIVNVKSDQMQNTTNQIDNSNLDTQISNEMNEKINNHELKIRVNGKTSNREIISQPEWEKYYQEAVKEDEQNRSKTMTFGNLPFLTSQMNPEIYDTTKQSNSIVKNCEESDEFVLLEPPKKFTFAKNSAYKFEEKIEDENNIIQKNDVFENEKTNFNKKKQTNLENCFQNDFLHENKFLNDLTFFKQNSDEQKKNTSPIVEKIKSQLRNSNYAKLFSKEKKNSSIQAVTCDLNLKLSDWINEQQRIVFSDRNINNEKKSADKFQRHYGLFHRRGHSENSKSIHSNLNLNKEKDEKAFSDNEKRSNQTVFNTLQNENIRSLNQTTDFEKQGEDNRIRFSDLMKTNSINEKEQIEEKKDDFFRDRHSNMEKLELPHFDLFEEPSSFDINKNNFPTNSNKIQDSIKLESKKMVLSNSVIENRGSSREKPIIHNLSASVNLTRYEAQSGSQSPLIKISKRILLDGTIQINPRVTELNISEFASYSVEKPKTKSNNDFSLSNKSPRTSPDKSVFKKKINDKSENGIGEFQESKFVSGDYQVSNGIQFPAQRSKSPKNHK